jgi:hypothetical protein
MSGGVDFDALAAAPLFAAYANSDVTLYPPEGPPIATTVGGLPLRGIFNERFQSLVFEGPEASVTTMRTVIDLRASDLADAGSVIAGWQCDASGRRWHVVDANLDGVAILQLHLRTVPTP